MSFFLPLSTLSDFDSFFITKDENLNPSLLPFMLWENVEPALSKLDAATGEEDSTESRPTEACGTSCETCVKV